MASELRLGSSDTEHLTISVIGRAHPDADDYWDGNWVACAISIVVRELSATLDATLRTDELARFRESLLNLDRDQSGLAVLTTMEQWITLEVRPSPPGQVGVRGELRTAHADSRIGLAFELPLQDRTAVGGWVSQLDGILTQFPVIATPENGNSAPPAT